MVQELNIMTGQPTHYLMTLHTHIPMDNQLKTGITDILELLL